MKKQLVSKTPTLSLELLVQRGDFQLGVDCNLPAKGITALFGPSGSGKTTFLRALAGLDRKAATHVKVDEQAWQSRSQFIPVHKRRIGFVFQEDSLFEHLDVRANLAYGYERVPDNARTIQLDTIIEKLELKDFLERRPNTLSGGQRQRVAIGRALAASPRLLLLDEPLASLDRDRRRKILSMIRDFNETLGLPMLYVSHDFEEVARLADHLLLLEAGKLVAEGPATRLCTDLKQSLARDEEAAAIVEANVSALDEAYGLSTLSFDGGELTVTGTRHPVGTRLRLLLAARDVSLCLDKPAGSSIRNALPVTVEQSEALNHAEQLLRLKAGETHLLARITRKSADELKAQAGRTLYALIKSVRVLH